MLYLAEIHSFEGVSIAIPLFRNDDLFLFISGISFSMKPSLQLDSYDILDLYKIENHILLPKMILLSIANALNKKKQEALKDYLWKELETALPIASRLLSEEKRNLSSVLWIGHEWASQSLVTEDHVIHFSHDGFVSSFDTNNDDHLKKWESLCDSLLTELHEQLDKEGENWIDALYVLWESEQKRFKKKYIAEYSF
jgi:hypothetical protein